MVSIAGLDIADVRNQGCAGGLVHVLDGVVRPSGEAVSSDVLLPGMCTGENLYSMSFVL